MSRFPTIPSTQLAIDLFTTSLPRMFFVAKYTSAVSRTYALLSRLQSTYAIFDGENGAAKDEILRLEAGGCDGSDLKLAT